MRWLLGTSFLLKSMLLAKGGLRAAGARPTVARQTTRMSSIALTTKRMAPTALLGATGLAAGREVLRGWRTLRRPRWGFQAPKMVSTLTEPPSTEAPPSRSSATQPTCPPRLALLNAASPSASGKSTWLGPGLGSGLRLG